MPRNDDARELIEAVSHAQDVIRECLADARRKCMSDALIAELVKLEKQAARAKRMILVQVAAESQVKPRTYAA